MHQHGVLILGSVDFCETFRKTSEAWGNTGLKLGEVYLSSVTSQFLIFFHWMVFELLFHCVTLKAIYWMTLESHVRLFNHNKVLLAYKLIFPIVRRIVPFFLRRVYKTARVTQVGGLPSLSTC